MLSPSPLRQQQKQRRLFPSLAGLTTIWLSWRLWCSLLNPTFGFQVYSFIPVIPTRCRHPHHYRQPQQHLATFHFKWRIYSDSRSSSYSSSNSDSSSSSSSSSNGSTNEEKETVAVVASLKQELMELSEQACRGFQATRKQRERARSLLKELARYQNPTAEPARDYYGKNEDEDIPTKRVRGPTLFGKWTLIYTDAPDITGLESPRSSNNRFPLAQLGRIGQDCQEPPLIKNVIEWKRPEWASQLVQRLQTPLRRFSSSNGLSSKRNSSQRILQYVLTKASASPDQPFKVNLELAGLQGTWDYDDNDTGRDGGPFLDNLFLPPKGTTFTLQGPLTLPFGEFEILYLDDEFRAIKTGQNFVAVNVRIKESDSDQNQPWF